MSEAGPTVKQGIASDSNSAKIKTDESAVSTPTKTYKLFGTVFQVTSRYEDLQPVGMGSFGLVCSANDAFTGQKVAIKKILKPFSTQVLAKRTYRELKILKHLVHDNIITPTDIFVSSDDIYIVTDLFGTDLQRLLRARVLDEQFIQYFVYQILRALKYVHSIKVIHRDLKPSNILVNDNCDLKICDFGLARVEDTQMTGYVSTRYYRAPEIMLTWQKYGHGVDIWSTGCILAEMLTGKPLFPGKDHIAHFEIITKLLGTPSKDVLETVCSESTLQFLTSLPHREPKPFDQVFRGANPVALDLLAKMLVMDPGKRITAKEALQHPYLAEFHDPDEEPEAEGGFDWSPCTRDCTSDEWKELTYEEIIDFHLKHLPKEEAAATSSSS